MTYEEEAAIQIASLRAIQAWADQVGRRYTLDTTQGQCLDEFRRNLPGVIIDLADAAIPYGQHPLDVEDLSLDDVASIVQGSSRRVL